MKQISIDALNVHLFEAIEMLKNNSDPKASPNEKIDIETAKTIADLGKVAVEAFKTKANVIAILSKSPIPETVLKNIEFIGVLPEKTE